MRVLSFLSVMVFLFVATASTAWADECDCPDDYDCEVTTLDYCIDPFPCDPDDENCFTDEPNCFEETRTRCIPPQCETDSDCSGDTLCVEYVYEACTGGGTSPGCADGPVIGVGSDGEDPDSGDDEPEDTEDTEDTDCVVEDSDEPECDISIERYCVPPYLAPCDEDADCGDGFTCEDDSMVSCVDTSDPDTDPVCDSGDEDAPGRCSLDHAECQADADCEYGFVCHDSDGPACPPQTGDGDDEPCDDTVAGFCAPPDYYSHSTGGDREPTSETPGSTEEGELIDSSRVGDGSAPNDDAGQSAEAESAGGCSTTGESTTPSLFFVIALLAGAVGIRRRR